MSRIKLLEMFEDHDNEDKFPYSADNLAIYM